MEMLYLLGNETGIVLSAIGAIIALIAIVQASVREGERKSMIFRFIAGFFVLLILLVVVLHFTMLDYSRVPDVVGYTRDEAIAALEAEGFTGEIIFNPPPQAKVISQLPEEKTIVKQGAVVTLMCDPLFSFVDTEENTDNEVDTEDIEAEKRIELTSCSITQNWIYGSYDYKNLDSNILLHQGDLYVITEGNHWTKITEKATFDYDKNAQTFSFLMQEYLPDGDYACEFRGLSEEDTFVIEIHFDIVSGVLYGESYSEMRSDGVSHTVTGGDAIGDNRLNP